jgi:DNA polymerase V
LKDPFEKKKMIATTRMFGRPVTALSEIKEAVATYVTRAAEKLRRQHGAAGLMDVFVVWKPAIMVRGQYHTESAYRQFRLPVATSDTRLLISYAMPLVETLYVKDRRYIKAGVILRAIVSEDAVQGNLFYEENPIGDKNLLKAIDNINFGLREDMVKFGAAGVQRNWKMRHEHRSKRYTNRWGELYEVC